MAGWSIVEELRADEAGSRLDRVEFIQPAIFAVQVALAAWWREQGIEPDAVVGQSMGEVAAASVAGALSDVDAARVICTRSAWVAERAPAGGMAVVALGEEALAAVLEPFGAALSIAALNGPETSLVSGDVDAIDAIARQLEARGVFCKPVAVDYASHCAHMDPLLPGLRERLAALAPRDGHTAFRSTVRAADIPGSSLDADYWCRNLREPVRFYPAIAQLVAEGYTSFVELSPHPVVGGAVATTLAEADVRGVVVGSLRRNEPERQALLRHLGALVVAGHEPDLTRLSRSHRVVDLPPYAWQLERHWLEDVRGGLSPTAVAVVAGHPIVDCLRPVAGAPGVFAGEATLAAHGIPWVEDHQVGGVAIFPTTGWIEAALAAAARTLHGPVAVVDLRIEAALSLPAEVQRRLRLTVRPAARGGSALVVEEVLADEGSGQAAQPLLRARLVSASAPVAVRNDLAAIQARCTERWSGAQHQQAMLARGLGYGPTFQGVQEVLRREGEALVRVEAPPALAPKPIGRRRCARRSTRPACRTRSDPRSRRGSRTRRPGRSPKRHGR